MSILHLLTSHFIWTCILGKEELFCLLIHNAIAIEDKLSSIVEEVKNLEIENIFLRALMMRNLTDEAKSLLVPFTMRPFGNLCSPFQVLVRTSNVTVVYLITPDLH